MSVSKLLLFAVAIAVASSVQAALTFTAHLTHDQEVNQGTFLTDSGASRPISFGTAILTLNDAQTAFSFTATIYDIDVTGLQTVDTNDDLLAAHIHAGPTSVPGVNGPVVFGFFGLPFNDNNPNNVSLTPFANDVGGVFTARWDAPEGNNTTLAAQLPNILAGRAYLNFHTKQFTGGEIRGQINVPDTWSTAWLLVLGFGSVVAARRRWQR